MKATNEISLDVFTSNKSIKLFAKQGDTQSRTIKVRIKNNDKELRAESGDVCLLNYVLPTFVSGSVACEINTDGTVTIPLSGNVISQYGKVIASVSITHNGNVKLSTQSFYINVEKSENPQGLFDVAYLLAGLQIGSYTAKIGNKRYSFTTTEAVQSGGKVCFNLSFTKAYTFNALGTAVESDLTVTEVTV